LQDRGPNVGRCWGSCLPYMYRGLFPYPPPPHIDPNGHNGCPKCGLPWKMAYVSADIDLFGLSRGRNIWGMYDHASSSINFLLEIFTTPCLFMSYKSDIFGPCNQKKYQIVWLLWHIIYIVLMWLLVIAKSWKMCVSTQYEWRGIDGITKANHSGE
jgi:hypothetical protein